MMCLKDMRREESIITEGRGLKKIHSKKGMLKEVHKEE